MENKLISMCDYIKSTMDVAGSNDSAIVKDYWRIVNYRDFLESPLELGQFVACVDGVPLEEPYEGLFETKNNFYAGWCFLDPEEERYYNKPKYEKALKEYEEAQSKVIFEGVSIEQAVHFIIPQCKTVESTIGKYDLFLTTPKAIELGLKSNQQ